MKNNKNHPPKKWTSSKSFLALIEVLKSPFFLGFLLTLSFVFVTKTYYQIAGTIESDRPQSFSVSERRLFSFLEFLDLKVSDLRFRDRGPADISPHVALLTIDDRSLEEVGRWPWSREKVAHIVDEMAKYQASALGFDIVFSEPQTDSSLKTIAEIESAGIILPAALASKIEQIKKRGHPDEKLAESIAAHKDRVVLGIFNEEEIPLGPPYQDYCRNEAFRRNNAEKFVKIKNLSFVVNDESDPFVDFDFASIFDPFFEQLEMLNTENLLKRSFLGKSIVELNEMEIRRLNFEVQQANMAYCDLWLTNEDPNVDYFSNALAPLFSEMKLFAGVPPQDYIPHFKSLILPLPVEQKTRWTINTDQLQEASDYTAVFNAKQDSDGTIRRYPLFYRTGNRFGLSYIPSLALQTFLVATKTRAEIEINVDPKNPQQKKIKRFEIVNDADPSKNFQIPVDEQGMMKINYAGPRNSYPFLSAKELFNGRETAAITQYVFDSELQLWGFKTTEVQKSDFIKDRAFIFGATASGIYDLRVTPIDPNFPGPEIHLNALANLFERNFIKKWVSEELWMPWIVLAVGLFATWFISYFSAIPGFLFTGAAFAALFYVDQLFFKQGSYFSSILIGLLIALLYVVLFFYKYLTEERKKKMLKTTFSKYVSPAIVDEILKSPDNIELGGIKKNMSVFFSDVRGFTTISEKLEPQALSDVLNKYLTPMTEIVFKNRGTLDKYMGDAIMAFFGAPIHFPDHADAACLCALDSLKKLSEIQKEFEKEGLPHIDIGIGINTSDMSVGNMGSDTVRSYTVMGDAVNLGSRLEGITKEYGVRIVISEFTKKQLTRNFITRELDWVKVKGKTKPVVIHELLGVDRVEDQISSLLAAYNEAYEHYRAQNFSAALEGFKKALLIVPQDGPSQVFLERCEYFMNNPPPSDWDGVYTMNTK